METKQTNRPAGRTASAAEGKKKRPAAAHSTAQRPNRTAARPKREPVRSGQTATRRPQQAARPKRVSVRTSQTATAAPRQTKPLAEVVYTPAKPFNRNRLLLHLCTVVAVVVAVFFSLSLFFKVDTVTVSGNDRYSIDTVVAACGIRNGDSLLGINDAKVSSQIITELPYVKSVRIGIKLPGTVNIEIEELDVVYSVMDDTEQWWLMTSDGRMVEMTDETGASERTKVLGVTLTGAAPGKEATALEATAATTGADGAPQPVTISGADRLNVALTILQYLEQNDIMGQVVEVDVSNMGSIKLQYGRRFSVLLGDSSELKYKISLMVAAVDQLKEHDQGTLDISFAERPEVVYTPKAE